MLLLLITIHLGKRILILSHQLSNKRREESKVRNVSFHQTRIRTHPVEPLNCQSLEDTWSTLFVASLIVNRCAQCHPDFHVWHTISIMDNEFLLLWSPHTYHNYCSATPINKINNIFYLLRILLETKGWRMCTNHNLTPHSCINSSIAS